MLDYFHAKRGKSPSPSNTEPDAPVLSAEDEEFIHRIATEGTPPELPERPAPRLPKRPQDLAEAGNTSGNDAQVALYNAQDTPLPDIPDTPEETSTASEPEGTKGKGKERELSDRKKSKWSFLRRDSRDKKRKTTATDLKSAAEGLKVPDANDEGAVSDTEVREEEEEMSAVLEQLNLAAVNNRVFSISKESQQLLHKFTLVLKDLVNGVPTAYNDLESLLTNSDDQIQRAFAHLPPWLKKLVEQLPSKMTKSVGPEMLAAAAEKHGIKPKYANMAAKGAEKAGLKVRVPSLKDMISKPGAVAAMLKSIMNFLKLRFPAFLGMNVLYSLALFVLLLVFWYCHKRGREVRLEKERLLNEAEIAALDEDGEAPMGSSSTPPMTTAPEGASVREVEEGMYASQKTASAGSRQYAEGGSLAEYEREQNRGR